MLRVARCLDVKWGCNPMACGSATHWHVGVQPHGKWRSPSHRASHRDRSRVVGVHATLSLSFFLMRQDVEEA